ncbi:MAG: hypothetical protein ABL927_10750, partial [Bdellovibrionales bacterium]
MKKIIISLLFGILMTSSLASADILDNFSNLLSSIFSSVDFLDYANDLPRDNYYLVYKFNNGKKLKRLLENQVSTKYMCSAYNAYVMPNNDLTEFSKDLIHKFPKILFPKKTYKFD